jgi:GNAT superfamily N-acetyltransferase
MNKKKELGIDALKEVFGGRFKPIILDQTPKKRISLTASIDTNKIAAYSITTFGKGASLFPEAHKEITDGALIGETFRKRGIPFERDKTCTFVYPISEGLGRFFDSATEESFVNQVNFLVGLSKIPYASITEIYSPLISFNRLFEGEVGLVKRVADNLDEHFSSSRGFTKSVEKWDLDKYLALAHEFLKKPIHVGIENPRKFIDATRETGKRLLDDENTLLLVKQVENEFVGYLAANIHPALHVNGNECVIRELYVNSEFRRKGIASSLITSAERITSKRGAKRVSLATHWDDPTQGSFYKNQGYQRRCDFLVKYLGGK